MIYMIYLSSLNDNLLSLAQFHRTALHRIGLVFVWSLWFGCRRVGRNVAVRDIFGFPLSFRRLFWTPCELTFTAQSSPSPYMMVHLCIGLRNAVHHFLFLRITREKCTCPRFQSLSKDVLSYDNIRFHFDANPRTCDDIRKTIIDLISPNLRRR